MNQAPPGNFEFRFRQLLKKIHELGMSIGELRLEPTFQMLQFTKNMQLLEQLERQFDLLEIRQNAGHSFPISDHSDLRKGDHLLAFDENGLAVRFSVLEGKPHQVSHFAIGGTVGFGKSFMAASIGYEVSDSCYSLFLDTHNVMHKVDLIRDTHRFLLITDSRFNPWDDLKDVAINVSDNAINTLIKSHYGMQFGVYALNEATVTLRDKGHTPNCYTVSHTLERMTFPPRSNRPYHRDTAVIVIYDIVNSTADGNVFKAKRGFDTLELLRGNTVLVMSGSLSSQLFLMLLILQRIELMAHAGTRLDKPLVIFIDEAQALLDVDKGWFTRFVLGARHSGIHLVLNWQNLSRVPVEILGNTDIFIQFKTADARDRKAFRNISNIPESHENQLIGLSRGECFIACPGSDVKHAILARTQHMQSSNAGEQWLRNQSRETAASFDWQPFEERDAELLRQRTKSSAEGVMARFLRDLTDKRYQYSSARERWERCGVRSADEQSAAIKRLRSEGFINSVTLPLNYKGHPITVYEGTEKAFLKTGAHWKPEGKGTLKTRAASYYVGKEKLAYVEDGSVFREGVYHGKAVDFLIRFSDGEVSTIEIASTDKHECHNALHVIRHGGDELRRHTVICIGAVVRDRVKKRFSRHEELKDDPRISIKLLSEVLNDAEWHA